MRLFLAFCVLCAGLDFVLGGDIRNVNEALCPKFTVRKEIRECTVPELEKIITAMRLIQLKSNHMGISRYDEFVKLYADAATEGGIVGRATYLPWIRVFLRLFEMELLRIDKELFLPYWDWTIDGDRLSESPVWKIFGGLCGAPTNSFDAGGCIGDGPFKDWWPALPNNHCVSRSVNATNLHVHGTAVVNQMLNLTTNILDYTKVLGSLSDQLVYRIGGETGDFSGAFAVNDPLFLVHLAFLDRLWAKKAESLPFRLDDREKLYHFEMYPSQVGNTTSLCYLYEKNKTAGPQPRSLESDAIMRFNQTAGIEAIAKFGKRNSTKLVRAPERVPDCWLRQHGKCPQTSRRIHSLASRINEIFNLLRVTGELNDTDSASTGARDFGLSNYTVPLEMDPDDYCLASVYRHPVVNLSSVNTIYRPQEHSCCGSERKVDRQAIGMIRKLSTVLSRLVDSLDCPCR